MCFVVWEVAQVGGPGAGSLIMLFWGCQVCSPLWASLGLESLIPGSLKWSLAGLWSLHILGHLDLSPELLAVWWLVCPRVRGPERAGNRVFRVIEAQCSVVLQKWCAIIPSYLPEVTQTISQCGRGSTEVWITGGRWFWRLAASVPSGPPVIPVPPPYISSPLPMGSRSVPRYSSSSEFSKSDPGVAEALQVQFLKYICWNIVPLGRRD